MRIIAGEWRGRKLLSVKGDKTRPTTDRVKEALFNIIMNYIHDSKVLDLYAGTGNMGLEALSRGCSSAVFIDSSQDAIDVIKHNCINMGCTDRSRVIRKDVFNAIPQLSKEGLAFNIIFIDPPYKAGAEINILQLLSDNNLLDSEGIMTIEHSLKTLLPDIIGCLHKIDERKYGDTYISFYKKGD